MYLMFVDIIYKKNEMSYMYVYVYVYIRKCEEERYICVN